MGKGDGLFTDESLDTFGICYNVIYAFVLLVTWFIGAVGLFTYQWIETTGEAMDAANIVPPVNVKINSVSCGLTSYCIDAAGEVSECSLPWPTYNDELMGNPIMWWRVAAWLILISLASMAVSWVYSFAACFGCFKTKYQKCSSRCVTIAGILMLFGLISWAAGFADLAVKDCINEQPKKDGLCSAPETSWKAVFPSATIEGSAEEIGCRICNYKMDAFTPSTECKIGWGAILVCVSCVLSLFSGCIGECVRSREDKRGEVM